MTYLVLCVHLGCFQTQCPSGFSFIDLFFYRVAEFNYTLKILAGSSQFLSIDGTGFFNDGVFCKPLDLFTE